MRISMLGEKISADLEEKKNRPWFVVHWYKMCLRVMSFWALLLSYCCYLVSVSKERTMVIIASSAIIGSILAGLFLPTYTHSDMSERSFILLMTIPLSIAGIATICIPIMVILLFMLFSVVLLMWATLLKCVNKLDKFLFGWLYQEYKRIWKFTNL